MVLSLRRRAGSLAGTAFLVVTPLAWPTMVLTDVRATTASTIYVSPAGRDSNPGTMTKPLKTLIAAQKAVRRIDGHTTGNIIVQLAAGTYRLSQTLALHTRDSGTNGHTVVWTSAPGRSAVVAGSLQVRNWKQVPGMTGMWQTSVPASLNTRQLYVNGQRASLASGPIPVAMTETATGYQASSSVMAHWRDPSDIDFVYTAQLGLMVEPVCPIGSIHGDTITMAQPCWNNSMKRTHNIVGFGTLRQPSYIENAFELLKRPGQFYLDRLKHRLYYRPRAGQNMATADVEAPALQTLISADGSASSPVHNIRFSNLEFAFATWLQPGTQTGFSDMQDGYSLTGQDGAAKEGLCGTVTGGTCPFGNWTPEAAALTFCNDRSISFSGDTFVHLGGAGLDLYDGSQDDSVSGSIFTDISGNGLEIGGVDHPTASGASQTRGINVSNNHLYGIPAEFHGGVALLVGYAAHTTIAHNQIDHVPYTGISLGWGGWPDKLGQPAVANYSTDNVVRDNLIFDFMQTLSDGGGIYTLGITGSSLATGEKVTGNVVYDQLAWGRALQSDDGATNVTYSHNALWNNSYDYGTVHVDFSKHQDPSCVNKPTPAKCTFDATSVTGNYWQQGEPTIPDPGVSVNGNTLIGGGGEVPKKLMASAGIESAYQGILKEQPAGANPDAPYEVSVLDGFGRHANVTWRPSYAQGANTASSYSVAACPAASSVAVTCAHPVATTTISNAKFMAHGYVVVSGLKPGSRYDFAVTAVGLTGKTSTQSIPSSPLALAAHAPAAPGLPKSLDVLGGSHLARLIWYAPKGSLANPVTAYSVRQVGGPSRTLSGLEPLIVSNSGGRVVDVIAGLKPGTPYRFSVAAVTPGGTGPFAAFDPVKPTN
jgi:hypothetical protein